MVGIILTDVMGHMFCCSQKERRLVQFWLLLFFVCLFVCLAGKHHCPVTFKIFNENSHIVAVAPTGNVYSWEVRERDQKGKGVIE